MSERHNPRIWTGTVRRAMYQTVVALFGPYDAWEKTHSPGRGLDDQFKTWCENFAKGVRAKSGKAVQHQIMFSLPETERGSTWGTGYAQNAILNKAAALEMGFIKDSHLPEMLAVGRERSLPVNFDRLITAHIEETTNEHS